MSGKRAAAAVARAAKPDLAKTEPPARTPVRTKADWHELQDSDGDPSLPFSLPSAMKLTNKSPEMSEILSEFGPPLLFTSPPSSARAARTHFQSLCYTIFSQQVADSAAASMYAKFEKAYPDPTPGAVLASVGWTGGSALPAKRKDIVAACSSFESVRGDVIGTSGGKLASIVGAAVLWPELDALLGAEPVDCEALRGKLVSINGIGGWTVDMVLLFKFRLPDIWPVGDLAFRRGLAATFGLPRDISENNKADLAKMNEIGEQFKGYRSLVAVLMYKVYDAGKAEERKNSPKKAKKPKKE
ncbi:hypothetical protein TeGR_g6976 [Tetraparma gracilis]|uniref:HhH-GPD domain-containing protein n=1 Tax=Tetraparma gracilis TaxID=2962635 RepID=A0ABQ6N8R0_9STRA|nr:hypothetical protein TeGR_g6976 [Tetraparma gracilis]